MKDPYVSNVESMRRDKDHAFRHDPHSPIEDPASFKGLAYFPVDPAYRVKTRLRRHAAPKRLTLQTSDGGSRDYLNVGEFVLPLPVGEIRLQAYQTRGGESLFVPFRDATSAKATYGAGRYLDLHPSGPGDAYDVDLNLAYNPFCAYSDAYSCPFPPPENWLQVPIQAGERAFPGQG